MNAAHFYDRASELDLIAEHLGAIRRRKNSSADVQADLAPVNIEGGHDLDIGGAIAADLAVHQADAGAVDRGAVVKVDSLDKRAGTVSDADDCDSYFSHFKFVNTENLLDLDDSEQATN